MDGYEGHEHEHPNATENNLADIMLDRIRIKPAPLMGEDHHIRGGGQSILEAADALVADTSSYLGGGRNLNFDEHDPNCVDLT
jgi:hypothetical protein